MDLISTRAIDVTNMALDGLYKRQQAIASNTANVMTPGYQRKDVAFEDQLKEIIAKGDLQDNIKMANSMGVTYNPASLDSVIQKPTKTQLEFLKDDIKKGYEPQVIRDEKAYNEINENNVDIENEMMQMAKTGMSYGVLANVQGKMLNGLMQSIKGQ